MVLCGNVDNCTDLYVDIIWGLSILSESKLNEWVTLYRS